MNQQPRTKAVTPFEEWWLTHNKTIPPLTDDNNTMSDERIEFRKQSAAFYAGWCYVAKQ
jgi:hypothetical protein